MTRNGSATGPCGAQDPGVRRAELDAFWQGMRELGYVEGQNIVMEYRWAQGRFDRLPELAGELVRLGVDVIVAHTTPGALAAKHAAGTIPVIMTNAGDPVGSHLVAGLAKPGGNVTGLSMLDVELGGKRAGLLKELVPGLARVSVTPPGRPVVPPGRPKG
jgi:ABC-type uncharacterized transport system substrate-binding protein